MHEDHDAASGSSFIDRIAGARLTPALVAAGALLVYLLETAALAQ